MKMGLSIYVLKNIYFSFETFLLNSRLKLLNYYEFTSCLNLLSLFGETIKLVKII
jgi:hypothetical protein